jgi:hypothetical protein
MQFLVWTIVSFLALYSISMGLLHYASHRWPKLFGIGVHATHHHVIHLRNYAPEKRIKYALRPWFAEQMFTPLVAFGLCHIVLGVIALVDVALVHYPGFATGFALAHAIGVYLGDQYHRPRSWMNRLAWYRRAAARHREHHEAHGRMNFEIVPWGEPLHWCARQIALRWIRSVPRRQTFAR